MTNDVDVIVIGAGVAGLITADRLVAARRHVRVLEARDRVGGRTLTVHLISGVAEAWVAA